MNPMRFHIFRNPSTRDLQTIKSENEEVAKRWNFKDYDINAVRYTLDTETKDMWVFSIEIEHDPVSRRIGLEIDEEKYYYGTGDIVNGEVSIPKSEGYGMAEAFISSTRCPECGSRMWEIPSASKGTISSCTNPNCPEYHPQSAMTKDVRSAKRAFYGRDPLFGKRY